MFQFESEHFEQLLGAIQANTNLLTQISKNQQELLKTMSTVNTSITQLVSDFGVFQTGQAKVNVDVTTYIADSQAFFAAVQAFITSAQSGTGGTVLSSADQTAVNNLDQQLQALTPAAATLDNAVDASDAALKAITVPPVTPPAGS